MTRAKKFQTHGFLFYVLVVHVVLIALLVHTYSFKALMNSLGWLDQEVQETLFYQKSVAYHQRQALNISRDTVVFFGDSMVQGLNVSSLTDNALNFGIGGDTLPALAQRISLFEELQRSRGVVIGVGINSVGHLDATQLIETQEQLITSLHHLPMQLWLAILPTSEAFSAKERKKLTEIKQINRAAEAVCLTIKNCHFLSPPSGLLSKTGYLKESMHTDGIHLGKLGYEIWHKDIQTKLDSAKNAR